MTAQKNRFSQLKEEIGRAADTLGKRLPWQKGGGLPLPADINRHLKAAMLDRQNQLEDASYGKIVPNIYEVAVSSENYHRHFAPIAEQTCRLWQGRLAEELETANSRQGRREYRFLGEVQVSLQPAEDLADDEVRINTRVEAGASALDSSATPATPALTTDSFYLERVPDGRRWPLKGAIITLGSSAKCDIYLPTTGQQIISEQHSYIEYASAGCTLFDGKPDGTPSRYGTFVNGHPVPQGGHPLQDGDVIVLAALDPRRPRPDLPGSAGFLFGKAA